MTKLKPLEFTMQKSPHSVSETVRRFEKAITAKGMIVFSYVDHSGEAQKARMNLNEEKLLIFGDPKVGTFLMQENPMIGMELPLRLLIWQNGNQLTQIAYIDPVSLGESYGITKQVEILRKMSSVLALMVAEVIQHGEQEDVKI